MAKLLRSAFDVLKQPAPQMAQPQSTTAVAPMMQVPKQNPMVGDPNTDYGQAPAPVNTSSGIVNSRLIARGREGQKQQALLDYYKDQQQAGAKQ